MFSNFTKFLLMGCVRYDETAFRGLRELYFFVYCQGDEMTEPCVKHVRKKCLFNSGEKT